MVWLFLLFVCCTMANKPIAKAWKTDEVVTDAPDTVYAKHMEGIYNERDKEARQRGESFACGICQMMISVAKEFVPKKTSEAAIKKILLESCARLEPSGDYEKADSSMICHRVIQENMAYIVDGISVGEDYNWMCQETDPPLCPRGISHDHFIEMTKTIKEKKDKEAQEKQARANEKLKEEN
eukprot:TRINITY_DN15896_c0_g1_i1.p1 TRINITY_DN15896_c0_g1~~TRINITY_DN15896_c0_g1_i1.p1  ORF type:complete len:182 (+),score=44.33 TRINITY_DN15896_c0_g1_i1:46-591(+)